MKKKQILPLLFTFSLVACGSDKENNIEKPNLNVIKAIENQDHTLASDIELLNYIDNNLKKTPNINLLKEIYEGVDSVSYSSNGNVYFSLDTINPNFTKIITSNKIDKSSHLILGKDNHQKYAFYRDSNLFISSDEGADRINENIFNWLLSSKGSNVIISHTPDFDDISYVNHYGNITKWLKTYDSTVQYNASRTCDNERLLECLSNDSVDLIILSDFELTDKSSHIETALDLIKSRNIPILYVNGQGKFISTSPNVLTRELLYKNGVYKSEQKMLDIEKLTLDDMIESSNTNDINVLINNIKTSNFDYNWIHGCGKVFTQCLNEDFLHNFMYGASSLSFFYSAADKLNYSIFDQKSNNEYATPYQAILLLADKYRSEIDYPILSDEPTLWQRALFSDMIVNYSRKNNLAQSDLGSWVVPESQVEKGHAANYKHPSVTSELKSFSVGSSNSQWTTTGWYTLPGQTVTLTRTDDTENTVTLKLNYLNDSYPRTDRTHTLYLPQRLTTYPTTLQKGQTYSFSSPYGGPIYLMFSNTEEVTIQAEGVAHHPSIDDYSSPAQIERFLNLLESTETPHIDIKLTGFEYHTKKHKLLNSIDETITVPTIEDSRGRYPSIESLISSIYDDAYKSIFGLIGVKLGNEKLADTLSADVKEICVAIAGADACFDENLHRQRSIQHVNFVDQARCGSGCSGNPADIQDDVSTTSWIVGHEIGHNLQTKNLDVGYTNDAENWKNFRSAVGEASNNIFPHVTQWRAHYERNKATELFKEGHANHIDLFNAYMSDLEEFKNEKGERIIFDVACGIGKGDRYNAMWVNEKQQQRHSYRLSFYIQMAMLADKKIMFNGTRLNNGYDIYTLVYQMSRLFDLYSIDEKSWEDNKSKLGFELFPYEGHATYDSLNIKDIPGNDFLLVALSKITALDWTPFWDLYGLRYSSLAHNQVKQNASKGVLEKGIYVIDATLPPHQLTDELDFLPLEDTPKMWPTTFATPRGCLGFTLPGKAQDPIELKENGKTLAVRTNSGAMVGEEYEFDGKKYIIANKDLLKHYKGDYANVITTYVTNLDILFFWNHEFNDDISSWDTSNVTSMFNTFRENYQFNQNISFWDTSKVTNMEATLMNAVNFDQDISNWDVRNVTEHTLFEANTPIQGTEKMPKFNQ